MSRRRSSAGTARRDRRVRPAELRERADEMAALLDEAAPRARRTRRRRSLAVPAAVAAFGALSVGGVGLALGLTPTGTEGQLPASPSPALADPASPLVPTTSDETVEPTAADLDPAVAGEDLIRPDDRVRAGIAARPSSGRAPTSTTTPRATTTTRTARPPRTTSTPRTTTGRPTVTRSATPRSTAPDTDDDRPTSTARARPVAERSTLPTTADPDLEPSTLVGEETPEPSDD
ncbi:hypothetical protein [Actinomycetospora atypica]|uniref:Uncharacterized protein n=1 Tax=Actinomycetospora atypica TaxID=1290095 RepID=A0ABV9YVG4_9PSEU